MAINPSEVRTPTMAKRSPAKKRKAGSSSVSQPSPSVKIQVETATSNNPIVVSFPGGLPQSLRRGTSSNITPPTFQWEKLSQKSASGRKIIGQDKYCTYSGSAAGLAYDDRRTKLCVGVYDKKNGTVVVREAASRGTVFALQQTIPNYLEKNGTVQFKAGESLLSYNNQLFEEFGSAKKRKALKSQAANQVELNNVVGADGESSVMNQVIQGEAMSESNRKAIAESQNETAESGKGGNRNKAVDAAHEEARRKFLPQYDENAIEPSKVFDAQNIAGEAAWKRIYNKVHACFHSNDPTESILASIFENDWYPSVANLIKAINIESSDAKHRFACAILTNHAVRFYNIFHNRRFIPPVNLTKPMFFGVPVEVAARFVKLFTTTMPGREDKESHVMSKQDKDRLVVHALLLFMLAHGKAMKITSLKPIANDLKVPMNECAQILRLAGCQLSKKGTDMSAVLNTPLTFPPPRRAAKRT